MKSSIATFILLLFSTACFSQEKGSSETKTYYDSGKLKTITYGKNYQTYRIVYYNEEGSIVSERKYLDQKGAQIISFYKNGNLESSYNCINDKRVGEAVGFYDSGAVKWKGRYENDKLKTDSVFNEEGKLYRTTEYTYYKNKREKRTYYDWSSTKIQESNYKNGKIDGLATDYYKNGKIKYTAEYRNGRMFGQRMYYTRNGEFCNGKFEMLNDSGYVEREGWCINGKPEGILTVYNSKKETLIKASFKDGKADGLTYYFHPNDTSVLIETYRNGHFMKEEKQKGK